MTACQHPTLYDATYHGVFSKFDSLEDKIAKLIEIEQYEHTDEIYLENREELEGSLIVVTLRNKIEDKYNESIERMGNARGLIGVSYERVQNAVNLALRISEDYDSVVSDMGNNDLVKQHSDKHTD